MQSNRTKKKENIQARLDFARTALSKLGNPEQIDKAIQQKLQEENIHQEDWLFFKNANGTPQNLEDFLEEQRQDTLETNAEDPSLGRALKTFREQRASRQK